MEGPAKHGMLRYVIDRGSKPGLAWVTAQASIHIWKDTPINARSTEGGAAEGHEAANVFERP